MSFMIRLPQRLRSLLFVAFATCIPVLGPAKTVVYPVEAIAELWQSGANDFQTKFSGIDLTGLGLSDEGWYVRYQHENLTLLFGPLPDRETAQRQAWELEAVRDAAVKNRASLASSRVDFVRFTLSGKYGSRGAGGSGDAETGDDAGDGRSGAEGTQPSGQGVGSDRTKGEGTGGEAGGNGTASGDGSEGQSGGQSVADLRGSSSGRQGTGADGAAGRGPGQGQGELGSLQQVAELGAGGQPGGGRSAGAGGPQGGSAAGAGQGAQAGQPGSASAGQSAGQGSGGGAGAPGSPGAPSSGQSGGGDPLSAIFGVFRRILGL
jgi:hypothetical protein